MMWKNAHWANPNAMVDPCQSGWKQDDDQYRIRWFEGNQMPKDIAENISSVDEQELSEDHVDEFALGRADLDESEYERDKETNCVITFLA